MNAPDLVAPAVAHSVGEAGSFPDKVSAAIKTFPSQLISQPKVEDGLLSGSALALMALFYVFKTFAQPGEVLPLTIPE